MGTTITFRRGDNDPTSGSGLTLAEPAFNTTLKTFHIGLGHGITAAWVGGPISGLSADIAAGITYKIPSAAAVKNYIGGLCYGNTGAPTITQYVSSFNGLTGAVGGVCAAQTNTFTSLQSFANGISASGATVNGNMTVTGNMTVSGGVTFTISENVLIEDNIITLNSNVTSSPSENSGVEIKRGTSPNVQLLWNESSDKWTFTNDGSVYYDLPTSVVTSFNGLTGSLQGVSAAVAGTGIAVSGATGAVTITNTGVQSFNGLTGQVTGASLGANTFTALNTFNAGISAAGGTFSALTRFTAGISAAGGVTFANDISVYGLRVGRGAGNVSTNTAMGAGALNVNTTGGGNSAVGVNALRDNTTGNHNSAVGGYALFANTIGINNSAVGMSALFANTTGVRNSAVGVYALESNTTGSNNVAIGTEAGTYDIGEDPLTDPENSIYIGSNAKGFSNSDNNTIVIGADAVADGANTTVIGNSNTTSTRVFGTLSTNGGISAAGGTFSGLTRFTAGISAAGGTFSALTRFTAGISAAGGVTFAGDISVNGLRVGRGAGNVSTNTAVGSFALGSNTTGNGNSAVGGSALGINSTGSANTAVGGSALLFKTTGSNNVALGAGAASNITAATGGIYIGYNTNGTNSSTNEIVIGTQATGLGSFTAVIGATAQTDAYIRGLVHAMGGLSAAGATFSSSVRVGSSTESGQLDIRNHDTRYLSLIDNASGSEIVSMGNSTLKIYQATGGGIYIGDYDGNNNGTYITVEDQNQQISFTFSYGNDSYTFPTNAGSAGQVLTSNGAGTLYWANGPSKTCAVFTAPDNQPPALNAASSDTRNSIKVLDFDSSTAESAVFVGVIPESADMNNGLKVRIRWMATTATSGAVRWGAQFMNLNTDCDSDSFAAATEGNTTTNATSGTPSTTELLLSLNIDTLVAGDFFRLKIYRAADNAADTMSGDAELIAVEVQSA